VDRAATFRKFIAASPNDPFPRYGLAMELKNQGEKDQSWAEFSSLMEQFPDYIPAYLMAGGLLVALGKRDDAKAVFRRGIEVSSRKGDSHAKGELEGALADLE
jgi:tetratricopeptide (TPR) repeat protein